MEFGIEGINGHVAGLSIEMGENNKMGIGVNVLCIREDDMSMLNLTLEGWLDGATALLIVCFGSIVAIIILAISRKIQAELLPYGAIMAWFASLLWLAPTTDFLTILATGHNIDNSIGGGLYGILSYMWVAPTLITALYLGTIMRMHDSVCLAHLQGLETLI